MTTWNAKRFVFKLGCTSTAFSLVCSRFPPTQEFVLIFGIVGFALLLGDVIATIFGEGS